MKAVTGILKLIIIAAIAGACAAKPVVSTSVRTLDKVFTSDNGVLILKPYLRFEMIEDGKILPDTGERRDLVREHLTAIAKKYCETSKATLFRLNDIADKNLVEHFTNLQQFSPRLARGIINNESSVLFKQISESNREYLVLVQFFNVKIGKAGTWDAFSGAITSDNSNSILRAALINCKTGKVIWTSEMAYRTIPDMQSSDYFKSCEILYKDFPKQ
jgi:hypothetical protein